MAASALRIARSALQRQINMGIVAGGARKMGIIRIVLAGCDTVGLKSHVYNSPQIRHHADGICAAVTSTTKLLRQGIRRKFFWIKDEQIVPGSRAHRFSMAMSRPMTCFA